MKSDDLHDTEFARRSFLRMVGGTVGTAWLSLNWTQIASAANHAAMVASSSGATTMTVLAPDEAADVEAIAEQIIPSDATPGARDAGVLPFIDRALAGFFAQQAPEFRAGLEDFQRRFRNWSGDTAAFAAAPATRQIEFLQTIDHTPFFDSVRLLTILGMFSIPAYGGNRDGAGWKLLGFVDQHSFEPPFGYYDRDYPGFSVDARDRT